MLSLVRNVVVKTILHRLNTMIIGRPSGINRIAELRPIACTGIELVL